jgi:hypothetical protein
MHWTYGHWGRCGGSFQSWFHGASKQLRLRPAAAEITADSMTQGRYDDGTTTGVAHGSWMLTLKKCSKKSTLGRHHFVLDQGVSKREGDDNCWSEQLGAPTLSKLGIRIKSRSLNIRVKSSNVFEKLLSVIGRWSAWDYIFSSQWLTPCGQLPCKESWIWEACPKMVLEE